MRATLFWIIGICALIMVGGFAAAGESAQPKPAPGMEYLPPPIHYLTEADLAPAPNAGGSRLPTQGVPPLAVTPGDFPVTTAPPEQEPQTKRYILYLPSPASQSAAPPAKPSTTLPEPVPVASSQTAAAALSMPPPPPETPVATIVAAPPLPPLDVPAPLPPQPVVATPPLETITPSPTAVQTAAPIMPTTPASTAAISPAADDPQRWLVKPIRFDLNKYPLPQFLRDFCASQGVTSSISEQITGTISGNFSFENPAQMLQLICQAQHIGWYFDGSMVYFYREPEMESRFFVLDGKSEDTLKNAMRELGLFDPRFPWRLADNGRLLMVQGPPVYLSRINEALTFQTEVSARQAKGRKLGVFRLKYASAADQTMDVGQGQAVIPGVAELLRRIINEQAGTPYAMPIPYATPGTPQLTLLPEPPRYANRDAGMGGNGNSNQQSAAAPANDNQKKDATVESPVIEADARLNAVLVWDSEERLPRYESIIDRLDQPLALVEIRAAILDVQADRVNELGINWSITRTGNPQWGAGQNMPIVGDPTNIAGDGLHMATLYKYGLTQFMARVSAMEKDGNANVLSRPTVLTQDNVQAILEHTETFYVKLEGDRQVNLANIKTGMILKVTPHVVMTERGQAVQLSIFISDGADNTNSTQTTELPRVKQSTITTQAMVHEGESLIIGGYYNEIRNITDTGVPVIKNIPGLGALFRSRSRNNTKNERLFVLSPRVLEPGASPLVPGTEGERVFEQSPGKESLEKPAYDDKTPTPPRRFFWNRGSTSEAASRQEENARK